MSWPAIIVLCWFALYLLVAARLHGAATLEEVDRLMGNRKPTPRRAINFWKRLLWVLTVCFVLWWGGFFAPVAP